MLNLIHYVRQMSHLERLMSIVRLPMRSWGTFRLVMRNNESGVVRTGKRIGIDLGFILWKAEEFQEKYPDIDVWIEASDRNGNVWAVEVERDD